jgi:hypothetical protein
MRVLRVTFVFVVLSVVVMLMPTMSLAKPLQGWNNLRAYKHGYSHLDWDGPHYAAFFSGDYGYNQHFLGTGGDAATAPYSGGIAAWDWYPPGVESRLLTPRTWLIYENWRGANDANNYLATVFH